MTTPFTCPECGVGELSIDTDAETEEVYWPKGHIGTTLPKRLRPAIVAFCNACEFAVELNLGATRPHATNY